MQDIGKRSSKACLTFSFINTLNMRFPHLDIQIQKLILSLHHLAWFDTIISLQCLQRITEHLIQYLQTLLQLIHRFRCIFILPV